MRHRGPDDEGFTLIDTRTDVVRNFSGAESDRDVSALYPQIETAPTDFPHDIGMAHRRYAIVDLSPGGHQPMWDPNFEVCVSFYGEVYNYVELRQELEKSGTRFHTRSDTEVILQAYIAWGTAAFARFNGPFAIALYDKRSRTFLLCRDRIGKATFYYTVKNNRFYWASEIKAFLKIFGVDTFTVSDQAVHDFVRHGLRDFDGTFWSDIHDFPPGCHAVVRPDLTLKPEPYWKIPDTRLTTRQIDAMEAVREFRSLLLDAVRIRLRADVPVAFELSGGMDSSSIVALAASDFAERITTYTVKHREAHSDEEPYARAVKAYYGEKIDYRVLVPEHDDFWQHADRFVWIEEEPFHSPNIVTNNQIRRLMREAGSRVVVAGSAGDEVLAGYAGDYLGPYLRYLLADRKFGALAWEMLRNTETTAVPAIAAALVKRILPDFARRFSRGETDAAKDHLAGVYINRPVAERRRSGTDFSTVMIENMGAWKMNYWVRGGSKANFGIPIEARAPFLDPRLVDFAFTLPPELLIKDGWHKWILRQAVKQQLPDAVTWRRRKVGFPFPIREWLMHSKDTVIGNLTGVDCPYIAGAKLSGSYDAMAMNTPNVLWRLISLSLWWRKVIEGKEIAIAA